MGVRLWRCSSCSLQRDSSWVARTTGSRTIWASNCCTFRRRAARRLLLRASRVCRRSAGRPLRHAGVAPSPRPPRAGCVAVPQLSRNGRGIRGSATTFARNAADAWKCHPFRAGGDETLQNVQRQLHGVQRFARLQRSIVNALEGVSFRHQPKRTQVFERHSPLSAICSTPEKTLALSLRV